MDGALAAYERLRHVIADAGEGQASLLRVLDAVYRSPLRCPASVAEPDAARWIAEVDRWYPTPFAQRLRGWSDATRQFAALAAPAGGGAVDVAGAGSPLFRSFRETVLEMWGCWRQVVHFLPFVLMSAMRRIDDALLQAHAADDLKQALVHYQAFYGSYQDERRRESDQRELLVCLLKVFRRLARRRVLGDAVFGRLLHDGSDFDALFPERFDAQLLLLQQLRNRVMHDRFDARSAELLGALEQLARWSFLELIATLAPLCRGYYLMYVTGLALGPPDGELAQLTASGLAFDGVAGPAAAAERFDAAPQVDEHRIAELRLYLVARRRAGGAGVPADTAALRSVDYLDLTPFLIAERLRPRASADGTPDAADRLVFALDKYREPRRELVFAELNGADERTFGAAGDAHARLLLERLGDFFSRAHLVTAQVTMRREQRLDPEAVRQQLWRLSREQLRAIVDVQRYDAYGVRDDAAPSTGAHQAYDEAVFVAPAESAAIDRFRTQSPRRALLVVGASGSGKSSLLAHHYFAELRAGRLALFITARQFPEPSLRATLLTRVVGQVSGGWSTLADLDAFLDAAARSLTIFIDAVNEYSGPLGPLALLADIATTLATEPALQRCRFVLSCRAETWLRYRQQLGVERPLDPTVFDTIDGAPLFVAPLDAATIAAAYDAYRRAFDLEPASLDRLPAPVRRLFTRPFMLALAARTYANRPPGPGPRRRIPEQLDDYALYERLTDRRKEDAAALLPATSQTRRAAVGEELDALCSAIALRIFRRLADPAMARGGSVAVPVDELDKDPALQPLVRAGAEPSAIELALQVGLVEPLQVMRRNRLGRPVAGEAYGFFHDLYTQYWLAVAYQQEVLGWLDDEALADPARLDALADGIERVLAASLGAPVLAGALEPWLQMNLAFFHADQPQALLPMIDRLAGRASPLARHQANAWLADLLRAERTDHERLYRRLLAEGSPALRHGLATVFADFWPAIPAQALGTLLDLCDTELLDRLSDVYALRLAHAPEAGRDHLIEALRPVGLGALADPVSQLRQARFALQVSIYAIFIGYDRPATLAAAREVLRARYPWLIDLLAAEDPGLSPLALIRRNFRKALFWTLENVAAGKWRQFMVEMPLSGNDRFFEAVDGVVQRDVLREFLPYAIALHNGELAALDPSPGTPFAELMLRMLDFRVTSVIGYNAVLCLPAVLAQRDRAEVEQFVLALFERRTPSSLFHGGLLLVNLAYSDPTWAAPAMQLFDERIVPMLVAESAVFDWSLVFSIAFLDPVAHWPRCEAILQRVFDAWASRPADDPAREAVDGAFYKLAYCPDATLGLRGLEMLLAQRSMLLDGAWRRAGMRLAAALLTRDAGALVGALEAAGADPTIAHQARAEQSDELVRQSRLFRLQVEINRFVAWTFAENAPIREAVITHFVGSLALGRAEIDFARGFRRTLVALIAAFFGDTPPARSTAPLTLQAVEAANAR